MEVCYETEYDLSAFRTKFESASSRLLKACWMISIYHLEVEFILDLKEQTEIFPCKVKKKASWQHDSELYKAILCHLYTVRPWMYMTGDPWRSQKDLKDEYTCLRWLHQALCNDLKSVNWQSQQLSTVLLGFWWCVLLCEVCYHETTLIHLCLRPFVTQIQPWQVQES